MSLTFDFIHLKKNFQICSPSTLGLTHQLNQSCSTKQQMSTGAVASSGAPDAEKRLRKNDGSAIYATELPLHIARHPLSSAGVSHVCRTESHSDRSIILSLSCPMLYATLNQANHLHASYLSSNPKRKHGFLD